MSLKAVGAVVGTLACTLVMIVLIARRIIGILAPSTVQEFLNDGVRLPAATQNISGLPLLVTTKQLSPDAVKHVPARTEAVGSIESGSARLFMPVVKMACLFVMKLLPASCEKLNGLVESTASQIQHFHVDLNVLFIFLLSPPNPSKRIVLCLKAVWAVVSGLLGEAIVVILVAALLATSEASCMESCGGSIRNSSNFATR